MQAHLRLSKLLSCGCEVKDVVDNLESQAEVPPILKHRILHLQGIWPASATLLSYHTPKETETCSHIQHSVRPPTQLVQCMSHMFILGRSFR